MKEYVKGLYVIGEGNMKSPIEVQQTIYLLSNIIIIPSIDYTQIRSRSFTLPKGPLHIL